MADLQTRAYEERVLDNTLPQAAFDYVVHLDRSSRDPAAQESFETFIDAYLNTPKPRVVLPGSEAGGGDGDFIDLWHQAAKGVSLNQGTKPIPLSDAAVFRAFSIDVGNNLRGWLGFLLFQLSPRIAKQYKSRVPDWRERVSAAWAQVKDLEKAGKRRDISRFREEFDEYDARQGQGIDDDYLSWVEAPEWGDSPLVDFAIAYGYDWYRRGHSYSRFGSDIRVLLHARRRDMTADASDAVAGPGPSIAEVSWHGAIIEFLRKGGISKDPAAVSDVLRGMREGVQSRSFRQASSAAAAKGNSDHLLFDAAYDVLREAGVEVTVTRKNELPATTPVLLAFATGGALVSWKPAFIASMTLLVTTLATPQKLAQAEFAARRSLLPHRYAATSAWRAFEMEGVSISR
jgi:hypothetical protein